MGLQMRQKYLETDRPALAFRLGLLWAEVAAGHRSPLHDLDWTSLVLDQSRSPSRFRFQFSATPAASFDDGREVEGLTIAYDLPWSILFADHADSLLALAFLRHSDLFLGAFAAGQRGSYLYSSAALLAPAGGREGGSS